MFGFGGVRMFVREMVAAFHEDTRMSSRLHHYLAVPFCCDPSSSTAACRTSSRPPQPGNTSWLTGTQDVEEPHPRHRRITCVNYVIAQNTAVTRPGGINRLQNGMAKIYMYLLVTRR